jgi:hypothetical protein
MTTIVCLTGNSMNDALRAAGRAHRAMFEDMGHDYLEVEFGMAESQAELARTLQERPIEFAYGAMGMGADFRGRSADGSERNIWEGLRIPFLSLLGDSPAYFFSRHVMPSSWHAGLYFYPEHLEFRKRLGPTPAMYGIVPPIPFDFTDRRQIDFGKKANGKLLFLKNGNDPGKMLESWRSGLPASTFIFLAEIASELSTDMNTAVGCDIDGMVTSSFLDRGWDIDELTNLRLFFVAQLDDYLRRVKSTMVADVIADFPVLIQGFNWEHMDFTGRRAHYVKGGDYTQSRQQIIESLGLIDMSPNTQRAPHDRVMRAFGLCTLCLTNRQSYLDKHFTNAESFTYRFEPDSIREKVADALAHPKRYVELGLDVAEQFRKTHHSHDFAQYMVDTASHVRFTCGPRPDGLQPYFEWPINFNRVV